jgi:Carboxypeptidase regulatory-like domain/TonB dependent receptor
MRRTVAISLLALVSSTGVYAQAVVGSGAITGIVKDIYGDGIPDTTISLTNKVVGYKRTMMTSDTGIFDLPQLVPGDLYDLKVTRRGYADWELPSFDLALGETLNFDITLYTDKAATPEEALRALKAVQDTKTSVSALINDDQIFALPTRNLQLDPLVLLAPAVVESPAGVLVFHGLPYGNVFLLDGISVTNNYFLSAPGIAPFVTQESTNQMQVISAAAPVEFGHTMNGIINAVSKTGINRMHAAAYDYYSQNSWDAPDFFGNGFTPTGRLNHAGVSLGLPISTDELFLFGNLERTNQTSEGLNRIVNPLLVAPGGDTAITTGCTATTVQCNNAAAFINQQLNVRVPMSDIATNGFARMDFRPSERDTFTLGGAIMSARAPNSLNNATVAGNGGLLASNATVTDSTRYATFAWTRVVNATAVNEAHGDWFRNTLTTSTNPDLFPVSSSSCPGCGTGPLSINVDNTPLGGNPAVPYNVREQRFGGTDTFTLTMGSHTVRVGADIWRNQDNMNQLYANYGSYNYNSFSAFALDFSNNVKQTKNYTTFNQTLGTALTSLNSMLFNVFVQDTWKVLPGLTITAGARWEKWRLPQPSEPNPDNFQSGFIPSPNTDVSPRIGIAYLLDNRTVVRLGGGTYFEPFNGEMIRDLWTGGGIFSSYYALTPSALGAPVFPNALPASATSTLQSYLLSQFFTAARFRNPYSLQGTFAIERRLNRYVSLATSYIQTQGVKIWTMTDQNLPGNSSVFESYNIDNAQGSQVAQYSSFVWNSTQAGQRWQVDTEGYSKYRAAVAQVRTAPIFGLSAQASYTWSHAVDDVSGPPSYSNIPGNYFPADYTGDRGNAAFDQRNRAVVNFVWQPIVTKKTDKVSRYLLNGWLVSGIGTYASSMYATPLVEVQGQQFTGLTMTYTSVLNGTDGWSRAPFLQISSLPIGAHESVDLRVSKALPITERLKARLIFEGFNLLNHDNVSAVNTIAFTAASGTLKPVAGLGAPIESYGYPYGSSARRLQVAVRFDF